jgi:hypothetical protein
MKAAEAKVANGIKRKGREVKREKEEDAKKGKETDKPKEEKVSPFPPNTLPYPTFFGIIHEC